jgi:LacI family transcriptional regulator, galactose operon repressor
MVDQDGEVSPTRRRRATLRDVAALAGVSFKTVSRVVNGEPGVSPELESRVRAASEQLSYRPNHTASVLRRQDGRSMAMALLVDDVANPFFAAIHRGVERVALNHRYTLLTGSVLDEDRERELVDAFTARRVDGLIVAPTPTLPAKLAHERSSGTAVVYVDRLPRDLDADAVVSANRSGAAGGVGHLIEHGHRRIGFLGDLLSIGTAVERYEGFVEAHAAAGIRLDTSLVRRGLHSEQAAFDAALDLALLDDPPTALFTGQNLITIGAVRGLRSRGLHDRMAMVGFDDFSLADLLDPPVTVVAQDPEAIGRMAAELLLERILGDARPPRQIIVPTQLIVRGSGELPPA